MQLTLLKNHRNNQNQWRCRNSAPVQVAAWKKQPVEKAQEQGGVCHAILTTQVNIHQLQGTLDTYFTVPISGNISVCPYDKPPLRDVSEVRQAFARSSLAW